jgi:hypothetical protein
MEIVGTWIKKDCILVESGSAQGRAGNTGGSNVVVNRPPVAIRMDFLAELECFDSGDEDNPVIYGLDCGGTLDIRQNKDGTADAIYFFKAHGKNWEDGDKLTGYRIDAKAMITSDNGRSFPKGEPVDGGYTVTLSNIRVSVDTGSRNNGCESSFPDASATVRLDRIPTP